MHTSDAQHLSSSSRRKIPNRRPKIAVLGTRGFPQIQGGIETHCENLYPRIVKKGFDVIVFTRKPYVNQNVRSYEGVTLSPLFCPKNKFLETFLHTFIGVFAARKVSPDILHVHAIGPSLFIPLARLMGLKVTMTNHGPDYQRKKWGKLAKIILRLGEKLGSKWANGIIGISEMIAKDIREKYMRDVTVIPNGVIMPEILQSDDALKRYDLKKGRYILAVGRFVPEKGFHDLVDAFNSYQAINSKLQTSSCHQKVDTWKLAIVGSADHEDDYSMKLKEKAGTNNDIVLTGFLTGKPLQELYSNAGLFVLPSYYEGLPIVFLEALSYGLSCIVSDIPANKFFALPSDRFFLPGDVMALALKIKEFVCKPLTDEEKKRQINMIAEKYDWDTIADKTVAVYNKIING